MSVFRKIIGFIFNPFTYLFGIKANKGNSFLDKHHILLWFMSAVCVGALLFICYKFIF